MTKRLALIVPEYRTAAYAGGGLAAVADFAVRALGDRSLPEEHRWDITILSVRTHRGAEQHRGLLAPRSWAKSPSATLRPDQDPPVYDVGAHLGEVEPVRYLPRQALTSLVQGSDAVLVVAGSPALANVVGRVDVPTVLHVATLVREERTAAIAASSGAARLRLRANEAVVHRMDLRGARLADALIASNPGMRDRLASMTPAPVHLLPPGIDVDAFRPTASLAVDGPIVMLGRLDDDRKNIAGLVRAYAHARDEHGVRRDLVLMGRNGLRPGDRQVIVDLGLQEQVQVLASPSPAVVEENLRGASVFALCSHEEGLGIVLLEAMACGLPVVSTATRGARFVVTDGETGTLVPLGADLDRRFGDALAAVTHDRERAVRHGVAGRSEVEARFSRGAAGQRWRQLVDDVAGGGAPR